MSTPSVELKNVIKEFHDNKTNQIVRAIDNVSLAIEDGEFFALLGPSGCGKTTTLRAIAGFEQPSSGEVLIRGKAVQGIPPFHRPVNTVFQDYALFPHMSIMQNVMFGLKMAKVPADEAKKRAKEALELVQLGHTAERKPNQLSGGQRQRIALARALVNRPAVLLLDEPLGALDLKLRKTMQYELKTMQREVGITFIFVTHDQEEALTMADRIAVMSEGKVLHVGRADEIYEAPANRFVADFIGVQKKFAYTKKVKQATLVTVFPGISPKLTTLVQIRVTASLLALILIWSLGYKTLILAINPCFPRALKLIFPGMPTTLHCLTKSLLN